VTTESKDFQSARGSLDNPLAKCCSFLQILTARSCSGLSRPLHGMTAPRRAPPTPRADDGRGSRPSGPSAFGTRFPSIGVNGSRLSGNQAQEVGCPGPGDPVRKSNRQESRKVLMSRHSASTAEPGGFVLAPGGKEGVGQGRGWGYRVGHWSSAGPTTANEI